jgi:hypothetical protein
MDAKVSLPLVKSQRMSLVVRGAVIVPHSVVRSRRDGFPGADSAEEVRRILETVDQACTTGMRQERNR